MPLREASIILPQVATIPPDEYNADGTVGIAGHYAVQRGDAVRRSVIAALINTFGGVTVHAAAGTGYWRSPTGQIISEPVTVFTVAIEDDGYASSVYHTNATKLREIAIRAGQDLRQEAVYLKAPNGTVEIVAIPKED